MKAITFIIAAVLSLQVSVLIAGNKVVRPNNSNEPTSLTVNMLAPVTPVEATFEDAVETSRSSFDLSLLEPVTPEEADFNDNAGYQGTNISVLAPETPNEADFN